MCVTVDAIKFRWKLDLHSSRRQPYTDRAQEAVEEVGPGDNYLSDCCLVDVKSMAKFPLGTSSGHVGKKKEEFIYWQQCLEGKVLNKY